MYYGNTLILLKHSKIWPVVTNIKGNDHNKVIMFTDCPQDWNHPMS